MICYMDVIMICYIEVIMVGELEDVTLLGQIGEGG